MGVREYPHKAIYTLLERDAEGSSEENCEAQVIEQVQKFRVAKQGLVVSTWHFVL
jgi:hypothetical protein